MVHTPEPKITFHSLLAVKAPVAGDIAASAGISRSRINEGLKPKSLVQDACPEELRWTKHFKVFYALSLLQNGPM